MNPIMNTARYRDYEGDTLKRLGWILKSWAEDLKILLQSFDLKIILRLQRLKNYIEKFRFYTLGLGQPSNKIERGHSSEICCLGKGIL